MHVYFADSLHLMKKLIKKKHERREDGEIFTPLPPSLSLFLTVDRPLGINFSSPQPSAAIKIKDGGHNIRYEIT